MVREYTISWLVSSLLVWIAVVVTARGCQMRVIHRLVTQTWTRVTWTLGVYSIWMNTLMIQMLFASVGGSWGCFCVDYIFSCSSIFMNFWNFFLNHLVVLLLQTNQFLSAFTLIQILTRTGVIACIVLGLEHTMTDGADPARRSYHSVVCIRGGLSRIRQIVWVFSKISTLTLEVVVIARDIESVVNWVIMDIQLRTPSFDFSTKRFALFFDLLTMPPQIIICFLDPP